MSDSHSNIDQLPNRKVENRRGSSKNVSFIVPLVDCDVATFFLFMEHNKKDEHS